MADWQNGDLAKAIADENAAIQSAVTDHHLPESQDYAVRANAEAGLERLEPAWADFSEAIRLNPSREQSYIDFGVWLDRAHKPEQGVVVLTAGTRVLPRSAGCWGLLGWLQYQNGQFAQSLVSSRRSEAFDGTKPYVRFNQGLCYAAAGDRFKSAEAYRRALAHGSDYDRQAALMEIRVALRKQPNAKALRQAEQMLADRSTRAVMLSGPR